MRIVTWNCNLSLSKKLEHLISITPDIAIIQECERELDQLPAEAQFLWIGKNFRKGLGVISFGPRISIDQSYKQHWAFFLPINIEGLRLKLLATWAYNHRATQLGQGYSGRPLDILRELHEWLSLGPAIVAGDFNNSTIWDKPNGTNNFISIHSELDHLGMASVYHQHRDEALGRESQATFFHTRNAMKRYHIDYIYATKTAKIKNIIVGEYDPWISRSDHVPLIADLDP
jgi:exonuclease III